MPNLVSTALRKRKKATNTREPKVRRTASHDRKGRRKGRKVGKSAYIRRRAMEAGDKKKWSRMRVGERWEGERERNRWRR